MNKDDLRKKCDEIFSKLNHVKSHYVGDDDENKIIYLLEVELPKSINYLYDSILCFTYIDVEDGYMETMIGNIYELQEKDRNQILDLLNDTNVLVHCGSFFILKTKESGRLYLTFKEGIYLGENCKCLDVDFASQTIVNLLLSLRYIIDLLNKSNVTLGNPYEKE